MRLLVISTVVPENESVACRNETLTLQFKDYGRYLYINNMCLYMLFKVLESSVWLWKTDLLWLSKLHLDTTFSEGVRACINISTYVVTTPH